ncbi:hypothetical protein HUU40_21605 [candidate division KSB1 bacterium]|nr:hypothetical protein [candidate division KSB1 bacterium]
MAVLGEEARGVVGVLDEPIVGFVSHFIFSVLIVEYWIDDRWNGRLMDY